MEQLHAFSIPGTISDSRCSAGQLASINRKTSVQGPTDKPGDYDMVATPTQGNSNERDITGTRVWNRKKSVRNNNGDPAGKPRGWPNNCLHFMEVWSFPWRQCGLQVLFFK